MHSRLSEEVSPKRDPAGSHYFHSSNSRLSEGSPPERGKPLAWASTLRLSESWVRVHPVLFSSMLSGWISYVWWGYCAKVCSECLCMKDVVHELWIEWFCMHEMVMLRFYEFYMMWVRHMYEMIHGIEMMSLVWVRQETWKSWYKCGMIMIWNGVPYSWFENNELVRFGWEYERSELWENVCDVYVNRCVCMLNPFDWLKMLVRVSA